MITQWHDLENWIRDNKIVRWTVYRTDPTRKSSDAPAGDKIVDTSNYAEAPIERKLDITRQSLELYGGTCYILGYTSEKATRSDMWNEIRLSTPQAVVPVPQATVSGVDEASLTERIRREIRMEYDQRDYERERKAFDDERRQFEADKASVLGAVIGYLKPYLPALGQALGQGRHVAGLDSPDDVEAARIHAVDPDAPDTREIRDDNETIAPEEKPDEQSPFTDEEADQLFALMARFKAVEPDNYLKLIARMVDMAESNDPMYGMAKGFLLK